MVVFHFCRFFHYSSWILFEDFSILFKVIALLCMIVINENEFIVRD
jgi:hypothetical protein